MTVFEQTLPNSAEAERAILGAILLDPGLITQALAVLEPKDFYVPSHRNVFIAMSSLYRSQIEISPVLIGEELKRQNALESTGGVSFITNLTYGLPHSANIAHYAKVVRSKTVLRDLKKSIAAIDSQIDEGVDDHETILSHAGEELYRLTVESQLEAKSSVRPYSDVAVEALETFDKWEAGETVAVPTQIPEVDDRLSYGGLASGDLVVIAARTSFGKSALALQIAVSSARMGIPVLIFSLEMPAIRLFFRNVASTSSIAHYQISPNTFQNHPGVASMIRSAVPSVGALPIYVDHTTRKLRRMLALAEDWHRRVMKTGRRRGLIIADYLQLAENSLNKRTRNEEVAGISKEFKGLAAHLELPLIAVSQLNRAASKENRRPELSDLRESGQIEQDADLVLFPWSKDTVGQEQVRSMEIYCPKQRGGKTGWEVPIDFDGDKQWFYTARMYQQERGERAPVMDFNDE